MRFKFAIRTYVRAYASQVVLNIICNILFALSSALIIALIAPFLELLFTNGNPKYSLATLQDINDVIRAIALIN